MVQSEDNVTKDEVKEDQVAEGEIKEDEIKEDQDIKTPKSAVWSGYLGLISLWMSWSWVNSPPILFTGPSVTDLIIITVLPLASLVCSIKASKTIEASNSKKGIARAYFGVSASIFSIILLIFTK